MTAGAAAALAAAGVVAGVVGTAGGITSLVSYPALLAAGLAPLPANVANVVALVGCWPGSALASRPELAGRGPWIGRWTPLAAVGGAIGAVLLLTTPTSLFDRVVPFLVLLGGVALLAGSRTAGRRRGHRHRGAGTLVAGALLGVSIYNGYFGAGAGVMALAVLLQAGDGDLATANALKNMVIGAATCAAAVAYVAAGPVDWAAAVPLGAGMLAGGTLGPLVTRRVPARLLRVAVALVAAGLAVQLWVAGPS